MTFNVRLLSHALVNKPETVVLGETDGIREAEAHEIVHLRNGKETDTQCSHCGHRAVVWLASKDRHEVHPMRCAGRPLMLRRK